MDVSIAVSLIRGQMGTVVERAVNGAVETVLAEMLKVVGVKFEELKAQVVLMKRDLTALQREKALKEKENDNIRAKLRYTELKLKYYRQGVEEELQQRASTLIRIDPSTFHQAQRGGAGVSSTENSPSCSSQSRTRNLQECTSPRSTRRCAIRVSCDSDSGVLSSSPSDLLLPVSLSANTPESTESVGSSAERDTAQSKADDQEENECDWSITLQSHTEAVDAAVGPPPVQAMTVEPEQLPVPHESTLPSFAPQVKQEVDEVICIKEEPEDEPEVMANLLLDCKAEQGPLQESEVQNSVSECSGAPTSQSNLITTFSSAGPSTYVMPQPVSSRLSMVPWPPSASPRHALRPWTKDLTLYKEFKLRRNEIHRQTLIRGTEQEKTSLLADIDRERREKTRLRVARWRAKRKLQACLNQAQALGGATGLSQTGFPISSQYQQPRGPCAATSSSEQRQSLAPPHSSSSLNNMSATSLLFSPASSSSSSSSPLLLRGLNTAAHHHAGTSSSSYPQAKLFPQSISLTDTDILQ